MLLVRALIGDGAIDAASALICADCSDRSRARLLDDRCNSLRLRYLHGVTALGLHDDGARTLRHGALCIGRNHPVIRRDQVPAWLRPPGGLSDSTAELRFKYPLQPHEEGRAVVAVPVRLAAGGDFAVVDLDLDLGLLGSKEQS